MDSIDKRRRQVSFAAVTCGAGISLTLVGCDRYDNPSANPSPGELAPMTPEQQIIMAARARMLKKFAGLEGVAMEFGALEGTSFLGVVFFRENTSRYFYQSSILWRTDRVRRGGGPQDAPTAAIPETARVTWRDGDTRLNDTYVAAIIGTHIVNVGLAVPDSVIEGIRKKPGGLSLKFMLAEETCYFGWHVMREVPDTFSNPPKMQRTDIGGNFCEAYYDHKENFVKGWHIHPKTGQRIETDS